MVVWLIGWNLAGEENILYTMNHPPEYRLTDYVKLNTPSSRRLLDRDFLDAVLINANNHLAFKTPKAA